MTVLPDGNRMAMSTGPVIAQTDVGDQRVLVATIAGLYFTQVLLVTGGDGETRADGGGVRRAITDGLDSLPEQRLFPAILT